MTVTMKCHSLWRQEDTIINHSIQKRNFCTGRLNGPRERAEQLLWKMEDKKRHKLPVGADVSTINDADGPRELQLP